MRPGAVTGGGLGVLAPQPVRWERCEDCWGTGWQSASWPLVEAVVEADGDRAPCATCRGAGGLEVVGWL